MKCFKCGADMVKSTTTSVTDLGNCIVIIRNVPCFKCTECDEIFYTGDVIEKLEKIIDTVRKNIMQEFTIIDFGKAA